jgi:hypothetical protein
MHNKYMKYRSPSFGARCFIYFLPLILILLLSAENLFSAEITLAWNSNSDPNLDGYKIFYRQEGDSYNYNHPDWVGNHTETTCTIYGLDDNTTYYFVARAVDVEGNESADSDEVCYEPTESDFPHSGTNEGTGSSGDGGGGTSGGGCFIATAAFGSYTEPHVKLLRDFRDQCLLTNTPGRWFVSMYYRYSPFWADLINIHTWCKPIVRLALMPLVGISYIMVKTSVESTLIAAVFPFVVSMLALSLRIHARTRLGLGKKITSHFRISTSGYLWPILIRKIREIARNTQSRFSRLPKNWLE